MQAKLERLNQIIAELELFCCYRCTHDASGNFVERTVEEQESLCGSCYMHELERRMEAVEFYPLEGFDRALAGKNSVGYRG